MKNIRLSVIFSIAVIAGAAFSACSRKSPENPSSGSNRREVMSDRKDIEDTPSQVSLPGQTYLMQLDGTTLTLYEISGTTKTPVTAIAIDPTYYPSEDIKELNKGIIAYSKEEGFAKMENYTN